MRVTEFNKMPPSRSRSRSPRTDRDDNLRRRSRSPRRRHSDRDRARGHRSRQNQGGGGFRWKEKRKDTTEDPDGGDKRLERGYRKRSRSPRRGNDKAGADVEDKFGVADKFGTKKSNTDKPPERPAAQISAQPAAAVAPSEPMIIVHVNDRLGTKAAIPCLASDPIKLFKAQVAARIGREPHEILLKRQGQRPFKDQLTLADYEISNGVQLDLEVDTGE